MTEARNNFQAVFDAVYNDNDEVIIHKKGRENVVILLDKYNYMKHDKEYKIFEKELIEK